MGVEHPHTWEQAVDWLRQQPDQQSLVQHCYYDDPLETAVERFYRSEEWGAIEQLLGPYLQEKVLDIGAGRGISSYAFAKAGCSVVALEPDPSIIVGAQAIQFLADRTELQIEVVQEYGEGLPFADDTFDIVYGRAVLHHAHQLDRFCSEAARVLKPKGVLLVTREHVLSKEEDLQKFLNAHTLHHLYGGENAYLLQQYTQAIDQAGLRLKRVIGPWESVINYAPMTRSAFCSMMTSILARRVGQGLAQKLASSEIGQRLFGRYLSYRSHTPGRHYSFLAVKA
ncbi:SAM-dependent methyltransferase [filamentous cyanobacterium CCT1]|nr:SAM-dependent methyltransferase [filamentous cyanobacterium CCT1]PSN78384.1 SAM-dependent methyltransferase [filamentous cyanobacterium CCP4]